MDVTVRSEQCIVRKTEKGERMRTERERERSKRENKRGERRNEVKRRRGESSEAHHGGLGLDGGGGWKREGVDIGAFPSSSGRYSALEDEKQFSFLAPWMRKGYGQDATPK